MLMISSVAASELSLPDTGKRAGALQLGVALVLDGEPLEALHHGVSLPFTWAVREDKARWWLPDRDLARGSWTLSYEPLARRYTLTTDSDSRSFRELSDTLAALRTMQIQLPEQTTRLRLELRARLEISALPPPMRLTSYLSPEWQLDTRWQRVPPLP